jgi:hypothetical protein
MAVSLTPLYSFGADVLSICNQKTNPLMAPSSFIYSDKDGLPEEGGSAGTKWQDIPEDW